jgi:hypothetical protein
VTLRSHDTRYFSTTKATKVSVVYMTSQEWPDPLAPLLWLMTLKNLGNHSCDQGRPPSSRLTCAHVTKGMRRGFAEKGHIFFILWETFLLLSCICSYVIPFLVFKVLSFYAYVSYNQTNQRHDLIQTKTLELFCINYPANVYFPIFLLSLNNFTGKLLQSLFLNHEYFEW